MFRLPGAAEPLARSMAAGFRDRTYERFLWLMIGAILSLGRHGVSGMLPPVLGRAGGHFTDYYRVFSRARWSLWPLGRALGAAVLGLVPAGAEALAVVDDTLCRHAGRRIFGRGRYRDPVRSTRRRPVIVLGHRWVVLTLLVRLPLVGGPWALPVLAALCRSAAQDRREGRRHKTDVDLARQLLLRLARWFPRCRFIAIADGEYGRRTLARALTRRGITLVSRLPANAALYRPPPRRGPARVRGRKLACPRDAARHAALEPAEVAWTGGRRRRVRWCTRVAGWSRPGRGFVPIRWVYLRDLEGVGRESFLFSSDPAMPPERIVELYGWRWAIEVTFQQAREHLGLESPRCRCPRSVLRTTPCLLGLYTAVALLFARQARGRDPARLLAPRPWYPKTQPTFADALALARLLLWPMVVAPPSRPSAATARARASPRGLIDYLARAA